MDKTNDLTFRQAVLEAMRRDIGQVSESGEWLQVTQKMIDDYVDLTGETGWIHTDVERAKQSKFGSTIAPGNMGVAILPKLSRAHSHYSRYPRKYSLNQGWDQIRFLQPLRTGSRVRARSKLLSVDERPDGSLRVAVEFRLEIENNDKSWLTGIKIGRFFFD
ncbi:MAG TPA: MaoC/PaaZ C-terminal domain-containing protein [Burkholderiales bacterium]|nr:MaoC/PaaZ C-terminal domain-containing protein [Burkholderiales bacterium]